LPNSPFLLYCVQMLSAWGKSRQVWILNFALCRSLWNQMMSRDAPTKPKEIKAQVGSKCWNFVSLLARTKLGPKYSEKAGVAIRL
jgi:hypothetical protein